MANYKNTLVTGTFANNRTFSSRTPTPITLRASQLHKTIRTGQTKNVPSQQPAGKKIGFQQLTRPATNKTVKMIGGSCTLI